MQQTGILDPEVANDFQHALGSHVSPDNANGNRNAVKSSDVRHNVGGATQYIRLFLDIDHRNRSLRRNAADLAPDELVQHDVAKDENALAGETIDKFFNASVRQR